VSTATRVSLARAEEVAIGLVATLGLGCERIEIAGSVRRQMPSVGDIELVAVPRVHAETHREGLFEERTVEVDKLQVVVDRMLLEGMLASHPTDPKRGPRYSKLLHVRSGLQVDLFSARPSTFGLILAIRTGPAGYSRWLVTEARARGHHVAEGELHVGAGGCSPWEMCEVVPTPEEADVYRALGLFHPIPEQRA
jgi:DNA polymerase/3'-5' exonuclease PolX